MSRRGRRSPRWWSATTASSGAAGAWGSTKTTKARCPPSASGSSLACGQARPMPRLSSTGTTVWAGVSSVHPRRCRASRTARRTKGSDDLAGLADRVLLRRQGTPASGRGHRGARRRARSHRGPGRGNRRGISGGRRFGARRLPLPRCSVDLREARVRPGPQDRQAPLGRCQGRRADCLTGRVKRDS